MPESKPAVSGSRAQQFAVTYWIGIKPPRRVDSLEKHTANIYRIVYEIAERETRERCAQEWIAVLKKAGVTIQEVMIQSGGGIQFPPRKDEV